MEKKEKNAENEKKNRVFILLILLIIVLLIIIGMLFFFNTSSMRLRRQISRGNKYLAEMQYDDAIMAYEMAIAIDPKTEDAYIGIANAYIEMDDYENAQSALQRGLDIMASSEKLTDALNMIEAEIDKAANIENQALSEESEVPSLFMATNEDVQQESFDTFWSRSFAEPIVKNKAGDYVLQIESDMYHQVWVPYEEIKDIWYGESITISNVAASELLAGDAENGEPLVYDMTLYCIHKMNGGIWFSNNKDARIKEWSDDHIEEVGGSGDIFVEFMSPDDNGVSYAYAYRYNEEGAELTTFDQFVFMDNVEQNDFKAPSDYEVINSGVKVRELVVGSDREADYVSIDDISLPIADGCYIEKLSTPYEYMYGDGGLDMEIVPKESIVEYSGYIEDVDIDTCFPVEEPSYTDDWICDYKISFKINNKSEVTWIQAYPEINAHIYSPEMIDEIVSNLH